MNFLKRLFSKPSSAPSSKSPSGKFIAARVTKVYKHPNADRLRLVELSDGHNTIAPVVCGAFNFGEDAMVVLALPGAQIAQNIHSDTHEPFTLEKAKIRGVESQGMICAEFELGLTNTPGDGILVLPEDTKPGTILNY